jgi:gluconolactonase
MKTLKIVLFFLALIIMNACGLNSKKQNTDTNNAVIVVDDAIYELLDVNNNLELLAGGFQFTEGPAWSAGGYLLFSDIPASRIYKWSEEEGISVFQEPSYNANGLAFTTEDDLIICEHSSRLLRKVNVSGLDEVLIDQYQGLRLNSPNDLAIKSDGSIYFTDPPYGLSQQDNDSEKELTFNGIFRLKNGELYLLDSNMIRPNGIAFSPDERTLYVAQSEIDHKWIQFNLDESGNVTDSKLFFHADDLSGAGTPDGLKVDEHGNLFCSGPGGIVIFSKSGKHLGTILTPEVATNCAFGGKDGKTLFITAQSGLYAFPLKVRGNK